MTDIVQKLREGLYDQEIETMLYPLLDEAADEIERLRSKIKVAVEAERESCAMIAEQHGFLCECDAVGTAYRAASEHIASAIRKREKDD
jgi:hypothetical protein